MEELYLNLLCLFANFKETRLKNGKQLDISCASMQHLDSSKCKKIVEMLNQQENKAKDIIFNFIKY